ncbi:unnamed protein product, partial [Musa textilis]
FGCGPRLGHGGASPNGIMKWHDPIMLVNFQKCAALPTDGYPQLLLLQTCDIRVRFKVAGFIFSVVC